MSASVMLTKQVLAALGPEHRWPVVAQRASFDLSSLQDPDTRVPHAVHLAVWREAAAQSGDALFGLRVAKLLPARSYGVLGFALASSATLSAAWKRLGAYSSLLYDELRLTQERRGAQVALKYSLAGGAAPSPLFEAALASLLLNSRALTAGRFRASEIHFRHRSGSHELGRRLGVDVRFGRDENALLADESQLELPLVSADPELALVLERYAHDLLTKLPREDDLVSQVQRILLSSLPDGLPSADQVARKLALGARTLQRRLHDENLSFRQLVDRTRHELALEHLKRPEVSLSEVAFSLGFADDKAFHKAFRRWTGVSPGAHREQAVLGTARTPTPARPAQTTDPSAGAGSTSRGSASK